MKKNRYILMNGDQKIGEAPSISSLGKLIGCTKGHIYHTYIPAEDKLTFSFLRKTYTILDKLA